MVRDWPRDSFSRQQTLSQHFFPPIARSASFQHDRCSPEAMSRQDLFQQGRYLPDDAENAARFQDGCDLQRRQPPMQIDEALRSHCGIAAKQYFVAAIMEDGTPMTFFSPSQSLHDKTIRQFFDAARFQQVMGRIESGTDPILEGLCSFDEGPLGRLGPLERVRTVDRRRSSIFEDWARQGRKRPRGRHANNDDEDATALATSARRGIRIGDSEAVWSFYEQRFKNCQQTACKLIAKAWVKAVEPKKQSTHPYTGRDEKAPDWWPKPWGPTKDEKVRHKEPDHLYKRERVHLLAHILRLVVEPNSKQHPDIQKLSLSVKKLEETTNEALSAFFMDNETNAKKRPYLNEIFKVARQEERLKNGEIDESTEVYVTAEDRVPGSYGSDNDDGSLVKKEEGDVDTQVSKSASVTHCMVHTPTTTPAPGSNLAPFMGDLPVRGTPFHAAVMQAEMTPQPHAFVEGGGMTVGDHAAVHAGAGALTLDLVASPHDGSRRPSVFSDYTSPGGGNLYAQAWQPGSTETNAPPLYAYTGQQSSSQPGGFMGQAMQVNAGPAFMTSSFEGSPRPEYDGNGTAIFRAGEMAPATVGQQGYYVPSDGRGEMRVMNQIVDSVPRNSMP